MTTKKKECIDKVIELRRQGMSYEEIAKEVHVDKMVVRDIIMQYAPELSNSSWHILKLELSPTDYRLFMNIKKEIEKTIGEVSEEYVFLRLMWAWQELQSLQEKLELLKGGEE